MKKTLKRMLSLTLALTVALCLPMSAFAAYSGTDAIAYADAHALNYNPLVPAGIGGDCANFVSQCLFAGGMEMNSKWYNYPYESGAHSTSWYGADSLKNYLKNDYGATRLVSKWTYDGRASSYEVVNNSANLVGDGREVIFYSWRDTNTVDHAAICIGTGLDVTERNYYGDLIDAHTTDRYHAIWHLRPYNTDHPRTAIYGFRV